MSDMSDAAIVRKQFCRAIMRTATAAAPTQTICARRALWKVDGVGLLCHFHFERYFETHPDTSVDDISRLSENDNHFKVHAAPGGKSPARNTSAPRPNTQSDNGSDTPSTEAARA